MMAIDQVIRRMEETASLHSFSLLGGPLQRLGRRLGLVHGGSNTFGLGLALGGILWAVLAALAFIQGIAPQLFSLSMIAGHARLLLVIPLLFLCESWLDPRMTAFVSTIVRSGVVRDDALPALQDEIARTLRRKDSWLAEAVCLLMAVLLSAFASKLHLPGETSAYEASRSGAGTGPTELWYWIVCLTVFRFLLLRWMWRLVLWSHFLLHIAKLKLNIIPTHPDHAGGLGYLEVVHIHFAPLVLAISTIEAASLAEEMSLGVVTFDRIFPTLALVLVVDAVLFIGPLLIFTPRLWSCRVKGLADYMEFAASYVNRFDRKWLRADVASDEPLLGTSDLQSLADLSNSINIVRTMRVVPLSLRTLAGLVFAALLPALPLLLMKYPIAELTEALFKRVAGL